MSHKKSTKFHESLGSSAVYQMNTVVAWAERRVHQAIRGGLFAAGTVAFFNLLILWTIIGYLVLYWLIIPRTMHFESALHFDFDTDQDGPVRMDLANVKKPFEFPTAKVLFSRYDQQWISLPEESRNKSVKRFLPDERENPLVLGEIYDVTVQLTFPETPANLDLGVFMVETELLFLKEDESDYRPLVRSRRPASIPYRTWWSTTFRDLFFLPARFFFGWFQPERTITIMAIEEWKENWDYKRFPTGVKVTLSDPRLNIKQSSVSFDLKLYGLRYFMYYWFWTAFALLVTLAATLESWAAISALLFKLLAPTVQKKVRFKLTDMFSEEESEDERRLDEEEDEEESEEEEEEEIEGAYDELPPAPTSSAFEDSPPQPEPRPGVKSLMRRRDLGGKGPSTESDQHESTQETSSDREEADDGLYRTPGPSRETSTDFAETDYGTPEEEFAEEHTRESETGSDVDVTKELVREEEKQPEEVRRARKESEEPSKRSVSAQVGMGSPTQSDEDAISSKRSGSSSSSGEVIETPGEGTGQESSSTSSSEKSHDQVREPRLSSDLDMVMVEKDEDE